MTARTFDDSSGETWEVFEVRRASQKPGAVSAGLEQGWLAFVRGAEKRRLAPFPDDWSSCSASELERLCASARLASARPAPRPPRDSVSEAGEPGASIATMARAAEARRSGAHAAVPATGPDTIRSGDEVETAVRRFAQEARATGLPAIEAMVRLKSMLAQRFPGPAHAAPDMRAVRRWFVEAFYFERDA